MRLKRFKLRVTFLHLSVITVWEWLRECGKAIRKFLISCKCLRKTFRWLIIFQPIFFYWIFLQCVGKQAEENLLAGQQQLVMTAERNKFMRSAGISLVKITANALSVSFSSSAHQCALFCFHARCDKEKRRAFHKEHCLRQSLQRILLYISMLNVITQLVIYIKIWFI